ncbi:hypothetical protein V6N11_038789 [Hibiscus sabdariffa]|uniref:Protein kinase domain-containing protein n=1 Tax=Hibiscus sabdariffa TaxID=183260 RepID=A0ABR2SL02_9ROSI
MKRCLGRYRTAACGGILSNSLSGRVPWTLTELEYLKRMDISNNHFSPINLHINQKFEHLHKSKSQQIQEGKRMRLQWLSKNLPTNLLRSMPYENQSSCTCFYKVVLKNNATYAVKGLKKLLVSFKEFGQTIRRIGNLKHRNIPPLVGYRCTKHKKLLFYKYQSNESLLNLLQEPLISEQGISRLLDSKQNCLISSNGYMAPKKSLSEGGNVFSFGVILLELLTGKTVEKTRVDLPKWVIQHALEDRSVSSISSLASGHLDRVLVTSIMVDTGVSAGDDSTQVVLAIRGLRLEEFLDLDASKPTKYVERTTGGRVVNPEYVQFVKQDSSLASWLLSTVSFDILPQLVGADTSVEIWKQSLLLLLL